jgi:hypothetical protein
MLALLLAYWPMLLAAFLIGILAGRMAYWPPAK